VSWLLSTGLAWLRALEGDSGFAEAVADGVAVRNQPPSGVTQARLGYCWSHLALLFPEENNFARAAEKSFQLLQDDFFSPDESEFRIYDHSFYLLFMVWYSRLTGDPAAMRFFRNRHALIKQHYDDAGIGGFGPTMPGIRSHNPYMHLLEAMLSAFRHTQGDFWLAKAIAIKDLFFARLLDPTLPVIFEFRHPDWSVADGGRIEIGHQLEWPTLLLELHEITGAQELSATAGRLLEFAKQHGFETGLAINAVRADGSAVDRAKLLWVQTEAARRGLVSLDLIRQKFFHPNGWSWHNRLTAEGAPVEEPANARLLYHVLTAAAPSLSEPRR